jgi:hypothetical protein
LRLTFGGDYESLKYHVTIPLLVVGSVLCALAQTSAPELPVGTVIPHIACVAYVQQSYALYLPSNFSRARKWPIIYVFDPFARGPAAVDVVRAAAEKFGYIVAASNNSKNGPTGRSREAAQAMWRDTQERLPIDPDRRYFAGLSGGARVATSLAISCAGCAAGVIANAAGFPTGSQPSSDLRFAYFATVGDADFNYAEFVQLRPKLDASGMRYVIRTFQGPHGWAPTDVWLEALEWMDLQAMNAGALPREPNRIQAGLDASMARASKFQADGDLLSAYREYRAVVRNFNGLSSVSSAQARIAELEKGKALKKAEKEEGAELEQQQRLEEMPSAQMAKLQSGELDVMGMSDLRSSIADLKRQATRTDKGSLVKRRALSGLVVQAYEAGQTSMEKKDYSMALRYFEVAAIGSANPAWAYYQRARIFAITSDKKSMLAELRSCLTAGVHDASALDLEEFQAYRGLPEFRSVADEWKKQATR